MDKIKNIINENLDRFPDFEYYNFIIEKVKNNHKNHPEVAIECCKSLIEGISKTIIINLDNSKNEDDLMKYNFPKIYKTLMDVFEKNDITFEIEYMSSFNHLIKLIGEVRTHRGDISHGKSVSKLQDCSITFASAIIGFTSTVILYCLEHYFILNIVEDINIQYNENDNFNKMLDDFHSIPNISYSLALYEQDYKAYLGELRSYAEGLDESEEVVIAIIDEVSNINVELVMEEKDIKVITLDYKEDDGEKHLIELCRKEELIYNKVLKVLDTYIFDGRKPLSNNIVSVLKNKPKLLERVKVVENVTKLLLGFSAQYLMKNRAKSKSLKGDEEL